MRDQIFLDGKKNNEPLTAPTKIWQSVGYKAFQPVSKVAVT